MNTDSHSPTRTFEETQLLFERAQKEAAWQAVRVKDAYGYTPRTVRDFWKYALGKIEHIEGAIGDMVPQHAYARHCELGRVFEVPIRDDSFVVGDYLVALDLGPVRGVALAQVGGDRIASYMDGRAGRAGGTESLRAGPLADYLHARGETLYRQGERHVAEDRTLEEFYAPRADAASMLMRVAEPGREYSGRVNSVRCVHVTPPESSGDKTPLRTTLVELHTSDRNSNREDDFASIVVPLAGWRGEIADCTATFRAVQGARSLKSDQLVHKRWDADGVVEIDPVDLKDPRSLEAAAGLWLGRLHNGWDYGTMSRTNEIQRDL